MIPASYSSIYWERESIADIVKKAALDENYEKSEEYFILGCLDSIFTSSWWSSRYTEEKFVGSQQEGNMQLTKQMSMKEYCHRTAE
jgi:hypothetical protein